MPVPLYSLPQMSAMVTVLNCLRILLYLNYECSNYIVLGMKDKMRFFFPYEEL